MDDSVLDKPYSDPKKAAFIDYFWSGKHHAIVNGINLISYFIQIFTGFRCQLTIEFVISHLEKLKMIISVRFSQNCSFGD